MAWLVGGFLFSLFAFCTFKFCHDAKNVTAKTQYIITTKKHKEFAKILSMMNEYAQSPRFVKEKAEYEVNLLKNALQSLPEGDPRKKQMLAELKNKQDLLTALNDEHNFNYLNANTNLTNKIGQDAHTNTKLNTEL